jgi:hypothetical protein
MTVLSKFANAYDPLLFWKRLPDELLQPYFFCLMTPEQTA